jgi:quercetin dioxygenase-like cupin family protein
MKIFAFDARIGREIFFFGSESVQFSRVALITHPAQISFMQVGPNGVIGYHQATIPQLFMVVDGRGWVRGQTEERIPISRGEAAFWEAGEWHETVTDSGLSAVVLEVEDQTFDPGEFLQELTIGEN